MAKKFCREGQRHDANLAHAQKKVREEAWRLSRLKPESVNLTTLNKLKELVKSAKQTYSRHVDTCDVCS